MNKSLIPVILAGGKGERFWPLSRKHRPKQFLCFNGNNRSLLQATSDRLLELTGDWNKLWVVTRADLASGVQEQLPQLPPENLLVEPEGRDTAPALAWATLEVSKRYGKNAIIGFFPADHWIGDQTAFQKTLKAATQLASQQASIVTLGIKPSYPATGYGYIEQGESVAQFEQSSAYRVTRFTEKPEQETAEFFLSTGRFSWNSGMFIFKAEVVLQELATHAPEILHPLAEQGVAAYSQIPKQSIDYALIEKTQWAYVLPASFGWDDLGDWKAIERLHKGKGEDENVELANHLGQDTKGTILYASDQKEVIVTIGLEDVIVVRDRDVTLVAHKNRIHEIKQVLQSLQADSRFEELL